jgi:hypothetical protein
MKKCNDPELLAYVRDTTLFIQAIATKTPAQINDMFQRSYRLYVQYDVEHISEHKPVKAEPAVRYWRHGSSGLGYCKTVDGIITECFGDAWSQACVGHQLICTTCLEHPITESEYAVAKSPAATVRTIEPVVIEVGMMVRACTEKASMAFNRRDELLIIDRLGVLFSIGRLGGYYEGDWLRDNCEFKVDGKWVNAKGAV